MAKNKKKLDSLDEAGIEVATEAVKRDIDMKIAEAAGLLENPAQEVAEQEKTVLVDGASIEATPLDEIKKWTSDENPADKYPNPEEPESVHILGHNIIVEEPSVEAIKEELNVEAVAPEEEPIPDVEDEGVDPDEIIDSIVTRKAFTVDEDLTQGNEGNPRAGQTAKNAAVRNVYVPRSKGEATNAPRVSSPATGIHKKPNNVKSVEGARSGMFVIDKKRPIRN